MSINIQDFIDLLDMQAQESNILELKNLSLSDEELDILAKEIRFYCIKSEYCKINKELAKTLLLNDNIMAVDFNNCQIDDECMDILCQKQNLAILKLPSCTLSDKAIRQIAKTDHFTRVDLYNTNISDYLATLLLENQNIVTLNIDNNYIEDYSMPMLVLTHNKNILYVNGLGEKVRPILSNNFDNVLELYNEVDNSKEIADQDIIDNIVDSLPSLLVAAETISIANDDETKFDEFANKLADLLNWKPQDLYAKIGKPISQEVQQKLKEEKLQLKKALQEKQAKAKQEEEKRAKERAQQQLAKEENFKKFKQLSIDELKNPDNKTFIEVVAENNGIVEIFDGIPFANQAALLKVLRQQVLTNKEASQKIQQIMQKTHAKEKEAQNILQSKVLSQGKGGQ